MDDKAVPSEQKTLEVAKTLNRLLRDHIVVMQAAYIEWTYGKGADSAMQWIANTLDGPGLIPSPDDPYGKEAQAYFDANRAEPFPSCPCGRPSNILWMGKGFCSNAHYVAAKAERSRAATPSNTQESQERSNG